MDEHVSRNHYGIQRQKPFKCIICHTSFDRYEQLSAHNILLHKNTPLPKWIPPKSTIGRSSKKSYVKLTMSGKENISPELHERKNAFKCVICQKTFSKKPELIEHVRFTCQQIMG